VGSYAIQLGAHDGIESAGVYNILGPMVLTTATTDFIGLHFTQLPTITGTDTGIYQAAPINRSGPGSTITAINLVVAVTPTADGTLTVLFQDDDNDPGPYINGPGFKPSDRTHVTAASVTVPGGFPIVMTIPLFTTANFDTFQARHRASGLEVPGIASQGFKGRFNFSVQWSNSAGTCAMSSFEDAVNIPTLTTTELGEVTGINKHWRAHSRADRCPRCGTLTVREKLVEDGFKRGLLVCQPCYDPPDFHSEWGRRGVGREREGIND
jgi:hypothetical protein